MFKHTHCPRPLVLARSQAPVSTSDATQPYNANAPTTHARPLHSQPSKPDVLMAPARRALWLASASLSPPALVAGCIGEVAKGSFRHGGAVVSLRELLGGGAGRMGVVMVSW
jgi:hypothetical protein